jgi:hypothetical protein
MKDLKMGCGLVAGFSDAEMLKDCCEDERRN